MTERVPLTPGDRRGWGEFVRRLSRRLDMPATQRRGVSVRCSGSHQRPEARRIIEALGYDVEGTIALFDEHGLVCDCKTTRGW